MGLFNRVFGGANGVQEAMRLSYANHVANVAGGKLQVSDPSEAPAMRSPSAASSETAER
jgi:hypothetical protein